MNGGLFLIFCYKMEVLLLVATNCEISASHHVRLFVYPKKVFVDKFLISCRTKFHIVRRSHRNNKKKNLNFHLPGHHIFILHYVQTTGVLSSGIRRSGREAEVMNSCSYTFFQP
jgi:hypothetical protein